MALPEEYLKLDTEQQRAALIKAIGAYKRAESGNRHQAARQSLIDFVADCGAEDSTNVRVWQPMVDGNHKYGLTVPFGGLVMDRQKYTAALQNRLQELIEADPYRAKDLLTDRPECSPDLYSVGMSTTSKDWSVQIMMCDQMMMLLDRIEYQQGQCLSLTKSEMPGLQELLEQV